MRLQYLIAAAVAMAAPLSAQSSDRARAAAALASPGSLVGAVRPSVSAVITSADKQAVGTLTFPIATGIEGGESNFWLRASGPLDEDDARAPVVLADLDSYRNAVKLAAGVGGVHWTWNTDVNAQRKLCRDAFENRPTREIEKAIKDATEDAKTPDERKAARAKKIDDLVAKSCSRMKVGRADRAAYDATVDYGTVFLWNVSGEYGRQNYKFADTVSVKFAKEIEHPTSVGGGLGWYFPGAHLLAAASAKHQWGFDEEPARQYCIPTGRAPGTQCRNVALAAPASKNQTLLAGELRWFANSSVGLSPRLALDLSGERPVSFELPILLRQGTDAGFTTAVIPGWRSRASTPDSDDRAYVALRIGYTFGITVAP